MTDFLRDDSVRPSTSVAARRPLASLYDPRRLDEVTYAMPERVYEGVRRESLWRLVAGTTDVVLVRDFDGSSP